MRVKNKQDSTTIASINGDSLRTNDSIRWITDILKSENIDLSRIKETHNESTERVEEGNYTIISGENNTWGGR